MTRHVLVETNWIWDCIAPTYLRPDPTAKHLLEKARAGVVEIHIPAICRHEAVGSIRRRIGSPERKVDFLKAFNRSAHSEGLIKSKASADITTYLDDFIRIVENQYRDLDALAASVIESPGVNTFGMNDAMLMRAIQLRSDLASTPLATFDQAIVGAILIRADELRTQGILDLIFCSSDSDTSNVTKNGNQCRAELDVIYRRAGLATQGHFYVP